MEQVVEPESIRLAIAGDKAAAQAVLVTHQMRLFRFVCAELPHSLRDFTTPEDIVQEVYMKSYAHIAELRANSFEEVFAWMSTIAKHTIIDTQRRFTLRRPEDLTNDNGDDVVRLLERLVVYRRTPSQSAAEHEFMAAVEDSLEQLPEIYREIVRLRHIEGFDVSEVAERMHLPPGTVRIRCLRGLLELRSRLEPPSRLS